MKVIWIHVVPMKRGKERDSRCILEAEPTRLGVWVAECEVGKEKRIMNMSSPPETSGLPRWMLVH